MKLSSIRPLLLCLVFLSLSRTVFLGRVSAADSPGVIRIENRHDADGAFSCDAILSGQPIKGAAFAVLFAESGQMKGLSEYPADETVRISVRNVSETDAIKIFWTDETYAPLANPAVLRMGGNGAKAYERFTAQLAAVLRPYEGASGASDAENPYALARLLVSCDSLPDLSAYQGRLTVISGPDNLHVLQFYDPADAKKCEQYLQSCPSARYVEPDAVMTASAANQSSYAPRSWGVSASGIGEYAENLRQRGETRSVIVAAVDSGVERNHPFLKNRLIPGFDFVDYDDIPQDEHGHGTHVAGSIADCTQGLNIKIMPVRVLDAFNSGSYLDIANGVRYAADHGANIINLSLGSAKRSRTIETAILDALSKNVTVVVAAGNKNGNVQYFCPAHMDDCLTVAAVDRDLKRFELSNYGDAVDLAAPGVDIESSIPNGKYGEMSGTSMAAPHVSAAAALLMSERGTGQTPNQISSLLRDAATDIGEPGKDVYFGAGFLNMRPFIVHSAYAMLYADGELVFQKDSAPAPDRTLVKAYPVSVSGDAGGQYAAWYERRADIRKVTFAESIRPTSTALWFYGCNNLTEIQGLERLDASELTDMSQMFARCTSLKTLDLSGLEVGGVQKMNSMFFHCEGLTELDLTGWNTENVTDTRDMFIGCAALKTVYASESFSVEKITDSAGMFQGCYALTGGSGTNYDGAHTDKAYARIDGGPDAPGYFTDKNAPIPSADIYAVLYADGELVFQNNDRTESGRTVTKIYEVDLKAVYDYQSFAPWYNERESMRVVNFADKISPGATAYWFFDCKNLTRIDNIQNLDTANVIYLSCMFAHCKRLTALNVSAFNTANVISMEGMFDNCYSLTSLDVSGFNTANVISMRRMFSACSSLVALYVGGFDTSHVTDMSEMFSDCRSLTALDVSGFNTSKVTDMGFMFFRCGNLAALNVSGFDTSNVTSISHMFSGCNSLTSLDVSAFDTSKVIFMPCVFDDCNNLTALDVSGFKTSNVTHIAGMFENCSGLTTLDVSNFDTSKVTSMSNMFFGCSNLKTIYASKQFRTDSVTETGYNTSENMFYNCTSLIGGAGTKYDSDHTDKEYARMDGGASAPGYFTRK